MEYLIDFLKDIGGWGYLLLFTIIFLESFPLTFYLPGDSLLFTTGFLASLGHFDFMTLFLVLYLGATLGYMVSYFLGEKVREFIIKSNDKYWFKKKHIDYTENFYRKYGVKTLIIGRFIPVVRSFSATLAGATKMNYRTFIIYTFGGGLFWVGLVLSVGFSLGKVFPNAHVYLTPIIIAIIVVSLLPTVYEYIAERRNNKNKKDGERTTDNQSVSGQN
jgi:membrane-associated protein